MKAMSANTTTAFNPFARHMSETENQPKLAEATVDQPASPKPIEADKSFPVTPTIAQTEETRTAKAFDPFASHESKKPSIKRRFGRAHNFEPAQRLLDWLVRDQTRSIVTVRDICRLGPGQIRNRERALDSAKILVEHGWLVPLESHRHDRHQWQIVRKPILCPTVAATA